MITSTVSLDWALGALIREASAAEPVTELELRQQLRVDENIEGSYLLRLGRVARHAIERYTSRAWTEQDLAIEVQGVNQPIIPLPLSFPFRSITAVSYRNGDGSMQTLSTSSYTVSLSQLPAVIDLDVAPDSGLYRVRYKVGHAEAPPEDIKHAILALARWAYDQPAGAMPTTARNGSNREAGDLPPMIRMLCDPYRLDTKTW